tara:strand:- start:32 stop:493 length:462 start_codon:yes stop_codon:yes gene_type:complete
MSNIKKIKIFTIILHSLIIIGAGHGIGILLFFDFLSIPDLFRNGLKYNLNADYQDRLMLVGLISVIGKIIMIFSLFVKTMRIKNLTGLSGILLLWISVYFLTSGNWSYNSLYEFSFWTSVPFLISSVLLTILIIKNSNKNSKLNIELTNKQKV